MRVEVDDEHDRRRVGDVRGISVGDMLDLARECERDEHDSGCKAGAAISSFEEGRSIPPLLGVL